MVYFICSCKAVTCCCRCQGDDGYNDDNPASIPPDIKENSADYVQHEYTVFNLEKQ